MSASSPGTRYIANLDFEYEWSAHARGLRYQPSKLMRGLCARWQYVLALVDDPKATPALPLVWGLTPSIWERLCAEERAHFPPLAVVERANSKRFSHELEQSLGVGLPYARLVGSKAMLDEAIAACPWAWVLKHPWGVSGREQVRGQAGEIVPRHEAWVLRQFKHGDVLIFEPWMVDASEFSMHFTIAPDGSFTRLGACQLVTDQSGTHRGNQCGPGIEAPAAAWAVGEQVAHALADLGYFGPLGIDAMWGTLGGKRQLRPLMEINARQSFGRLTLALRRYLPEGWRYSWWHPSAREARAFLEALEAQGCALSPVSHAAKDDGFFRMPDAADPGGESGTFILASSP